MQKANTQKVYIKMARMLTLLYHRIQLYSCRV